MSRDGNERIPTRGVAVAEIEQPEEIAEEAADVGQERLDRTALDILLTTVIGGGEVSVGGLVGMAVSGAALESIPGLGLYGALALGGFAFPVGLLFVVAGRSELFTENFLLPVFSVVNRERSPTLLLQLWGLSWLGNLAGCAITAALISVPGAVGEPILHGYRAYAEYKLSGTLVGDIASALIAGAIMTMLTWLLTSIVHPVGRMILIFAVGYVLFATNVAHSIVGASQIFVGFALAGHTVRDVLAWIVLVSLGNLVGGVGLVTLFRVLQTREKQRHR